MLTENKDFIISELSLIVGMLRGMLYFKELSKNQSELLEKIDKKLDDLFYKKEVK
jgi:hypothetical protein